MQKPNEENGDAQDDILCIVCWNLGQGLVGKTKPMSKEAAEQEVRDAAMQGVRAWIKQVGDD
jgi:hypothetical protein